MARLRRNSGGEGLNAWPGYVDALSTLLMVIIFVLLVFVLAQAFLGVALSGRDQALERLNRSMAELSDMLALERGRSADMRASLADLGRDLAAAGAARDGLAQQLAALRAEQARLMADRDGLRAERDRFSARAADLDLQLQSAKARGEQLQAQLGEAARQGDSANRDRAATDAALIESRRLAETRARDLAAAEARIKALQQQAEELDRTVKADRATIEAKLSELAQLSEQAKALTALRDELERQAREAARGKGEADAALAEERRLGDSARAQVALLNRNIEAMRAQLASVAAALEAAEASGRDKDAQIVNLGQRLNAALAQKVEELQRYRSDFFGKLREVLANRPGIQVVGDRFVFQSEVLFPTGSADLTVTGWEQVKALAATLLAVARDIPPDVNWVLRVDGHADRQKVQSARFPSNWELSAARAITVVKLLVAEGVPASRLAATGFGDNQPLDPGSTPDAYARNRRIELRLTDR